MPIITFPQKDPDDDDGENSFQDHYKKHEKKIKIIKYKIIGEIKKGIKNVE